ncbi:hypothetical protein C8R43DRAFT_1245290 [Mycena crocata]|nr:hypothetical protein C8R43DRAFT_1245290 [Mycena crocata]
MPTLRFFHLWTHAAYNTTTLANTHECGLEVAPAAAVAKLRAGCGRTGRRCCGTASRRCGNALHCSVAAIDAAHPFAHMSTQHWTPHHAPYHRCLCVVTPPRLAPLSCYQLTTPPYKTARVAHGTERSTSPTAWISTPPLRTSTARGSADVERIPEFFTSLLSMAVDAAHPSARATAHFVPMPYTLRGVRIRASRSVNGCRLQPYGCTSMPTALLVAGVHITPFSKA